MTHIKNFFIFIYSARYHILIYLLILSSSLVVLYLFPEIMVTIALALPFAYFIYNVGKKISLRYNEYKKNILNTSKEKKLTLGSFNDTKNKLAVDQCETYSQLITVVNSSNYQNDDFQKPIINNGLLTPSNSEIKNRKRSYSI